MTVAEKSVNSLEPADIPGLLFRGYRKHRFATLILLRVGDAGAARSWLQALLEDPALHFGPDRPGVQVLHVAFTYAGIQELGIAKDLRDSFAPAFREGMTSDHRVRILGDVGSSAAAGWSWGGADQPVDVLLALYTAGDDEALHRRRVLAELERAEAARLARVRDLKATPLPEVASEAILREHFGFADGISQPVWRGSGLENRLTPRERALHLVAPGEFVLGQPNAYGVVTPVPRIRDHDWAFGTNGTYLVLRQLSQDVAGFWKYFREQAAGDSADQEPSPDVRLAAKAVGRWPDGSPLTTCPHQPDPFQGRRNDFGFASFDADGRRCPVGAHVRRGNPRDSKEDDPAAAIAHANTHRLLRRGRNYGAPPDASPDRESRGLLFMCLNANLERQFEFVQQSWIQNESFAGLQGERDPLIATQPEHGGRFSIPEEPVRRRLSGIPQFVTVKGGAYFFLPGRRGLEQLAGGDTLASSTDPGLRLGSQS